MAAGAFIFLVLVLLGYYYYAYIMPKSCKVDTDCTAPKTCLSGSCAAPGGAATGTAQPEVYYFDNGRYAFQSSDAALAAAKSAGLTDATIASVDQLTAAQGKGANWCDAGWDAGGSGQMPSNGTGSLDSGCSSAGVLTYGTGGPFGANLYGVKPAQSRFPNPCTSTAGGPACVLPFNNTKWSQYS